MPTGAHFDVSLSKNCSQGIRHPGQSPASLDQCAFLSLFTLRAILLVDGISVKNIFKYRT